MTDLTREQIEAVCEALGNWRSGAFDYTADEFPVAPLAAKAITAIRQLQQPWRGMESAPMTADAPWVIGTDGVNVAPMTWAIDCDDEGYTGWCGATQCQGGSLYYDAVILDFTPIAWMPLPLPPAGDV